MPHAFRALPTNAPPAPRELSADIQADSAVFGRFLRLFGGIWASVSGVIAVFSILVTLASGAPGLALGSTMGGLFTVAGLLVWSIGRIQRTLAERVFRDGVEVSGEVVDVFHDHLVRMNGRSPYRVVYAFMAEGKQRKGTATFWDLEPPRVTMGERVTVLHAPGHPSRSVLWTRLERGGDAPVEEQQTRSDGPRIELAKGRIAVSSEEEAEGEEEEASRDERAPSTLARRGKEPR